MSEHHAGVRWTRSSPDFTYDSYNRAHEMLFKHGAVALAGSAAPAFKGDAELVDPEETFVASLSSCHMLSFLAICARKRLVVDAYEDDAVGILEKRSDGPFWISRVILRPRVRFAPGMDTARVDEIHHIAHETCFIANSVKTEIRIEPRP